MRTCVLVLLFTGLVVAGADPQQSGGALNGAKAEVEKLIAENKFLNKRACERMVEILSSQRFNEGIPAGLPAATRVAHKTGEITKHNHDAAIVYLPGRKPYVIVVLTGGIAEHRRSSKLIAEISRKVYQSLAQ